MNSVASLRAGGPCRPALHGIRQRCAVPQARTARYRTRASDSDNKFSLAPASPQTPYGEMMAYYLTMEPALFEEAVTGQFKRLHGEKEMSDEQREAAQADPKGLALSSLDNRINEVRLTERRTTVEDLMYMCIIAEFVKLGVGMMPRMDDYTSLEGVSLSPLLEGIHSREAIDMVKGHLKTLLGQVALAPPTATIKMAKIQMVQIYSASVMFGYFLRKVDKRFQLAKSLGMLPVEKEEAVSRLERLFSMASEQDDDSDPDAAGPLSDDDVESIRSAAKSDKGDAASDDAAAGTERKPLLREYIDSFDRETMIATARIMSKEGANLLDRQNRALWGDVNQLQQEMQEVIGMDASSLEELMKRAEAAVQEDKVETVTMSVSTQRRAVLEAVAYGTFLRDIETSVGQEYGLLTSLPPPPPPSGGAGPQMLPGSA